MNKRAITLGLLLLLLAIQWPLWFGKGGWLRVRELQGELGSQNALNEDLRLRNQKLRSEVSSLRDGVDAIEERARYELGMIGEGEVYVQVVTPAVEQGVTAPVAPAVAPAAAKPSAAKPVAAKSPASASASASAPASVSAKANTPTSSSSVQRPAID